MPNYTTKLNLEKPLGNEFYNIEVHNSNSDKIDAFANEIELRKLNKTGDTADDLKVTKVPVDLLDTVRKKELNSMAGGEIKGYIEDGGSHLVGEIWLSRNNIGEFKCLTTNTDTYINAAKWVQIDDLTNASKLENLNRYYGNYNDLGQKTYGNLNLVNLVSTDGYQEFSVEHAGVYLIIATWRLYAETTVAADFSLLKNNVSFSTIQTNVPNFATAHYVEVPTISATIDLVAGDRVKIVRTHYTSYLQRQFTMVRLF